MIPPAILPLISYFVPGATLVAHSSGGLIFSGANGYMAGTFIATSTIKATLAAVGGGLLSIAGLYIGGGLAAIWGGAGIFGTTLGATGIKGLLMSVGLIASTPIWLPVAIGLTGLLCLFGAYRVHRLLKKLDATPINQEAQFTRGEARIIKLVLMQMAKRRLAVTSVEVPG